MMLLSLTIPILLLLFVTLVAETIEQGWLAPGPFCGLFWLGCLVVPLVLAPDFYVVPAAVWVITFFAIIFIAGTVLGSRTTLYRVDESHLPNTKVGVDIVTFRFYLMISATIGMLAVIVLLRSKGHSVQVLTSVNSLGVISREFAIARYQDDFVPPFVARILMASVYFSGLTGGTLYAMGKRRPDYVISFIPFIPALLYGAVLTSRAPVLYTMLLWVSAFLAMLIFCKKGNIELFTLGNIFRVCIGIGGIVGLFILFSMLRYDMLSLAFVADIFFRLRVWFFGYLAGFSQWYDGAYMFTSDFGFGRYTFSGIFSSLGLFKREMGIFTDFRQISDIAEGINVYTLFRGLLEDFGLIGTVILIAGCGILCGRAYQEVVTGNQRFIPVLVLFFSITLWSNVTCILNYNSILLALLFYSLLLLRYSKESHNE